MKISILASIWCQNLWDELILKNEIKLLKKEFLEENKFVVFSYDINNTFIKDKNIIYKNYFPNSSKKLKNLLKNFLGFFSFLKEIISSDLIVIWWWWIFYDKENQNTRNPLDLWIFRTKIARFFLKKIYFFRVSIDIKNKENYKKIKKIFKNAYKISVRDKSSKGVLENLWIKSEIELDPVFFDNWNPPEKTSQIEKINSFEFSVENLKNKDFSFSGKTVWIAFRSSYLVKKSNISERMEEWILREIIIYLVLSGAKIIMLPHSFHKTDKKANDYIFLKKFIWNNSVEIKKDLSSVYNIYKNKKIDFCLSMRLHSMILCEVYQIPYIAVSYSNKTENLEY